MRCCESIQGIDSKARGRSTCAADPRSFETARTQRDSLRKHAHLFVIGAMSCRDSESFLRNSRSPVDLKFGLLNRYCNSLRLSVMTQCQSTTHLRRSPFLRAQATPTVAATVAAIIAKTNASSTASCPSSKE